MTILKRGSRGAEVKALQERLHLIPDGIFGPITEEAVRTFQLEHGLEADGIAGPRTMSVLLSPLSDPIIPQSLLRTPLATRRIDKIILHCTATKEGKDYTVDQVRRWHLARNFSDIGYHYLISLDGTVHEGRPVDKVGAHCTGQNSHSIGIVYVGGLDSDGNPKDTRTPSQRSALRSLVDYLVKKTGAAVHGHYEFANKLCPCFKIKDL